MCAEVLVAHIASNSELTEVLSGLLSELLVLLIFLVVINSTCLLHIHYVTAGTLNHIRIISCGNIHSQHFNFLPLLCREYFFDFPFSNYGLTGSALGIFEWKYRWSFVNLSHSLRRVVYETRQMVKVKALGWLEHTHFIGFFFILGNHPHAEFTHICLVNWHNLSGSSSKLHHHTTHHHLIVLWSCDLLNSWTTILRSSKARVEILLL